MKFPVPLGDSTEAEGLPERAQQLGADGVVIRLRRGQAEHPADEVSELLILLDAALAVEIGDRVVAAKIDVSESVEC